MIHSYVNITEKNNIAIDKDLQRKKTRKIEITTLKLNYIVYWKERRGAHLDKLILCPFKLCITKDLILLIKKERKNDKIAQKVIEGILIH